MPCSTGYATPTSGTYYLKKYAGWEWKGLFGDVYGQYTTQVTGNILLHSVPYTRKYDKSSLEYWEYDKLGTAASMGCIRLNVANARWIFYNCEAGTPVTFYMDSNPGPLGKPASQKYLRKQNIEDGTQQIQIPKILGTIIINQLHQKKMKKYYRKCNTRQ